MIREERLLKVILAPHVSEKSTIAASASMGVPSSLVGDMMWSSIEPWPSPCPSPP